MHGDFFPKTSLLVNNQSLCADKKCLFSNYTFIRYTRLLDRLEYSRVEENVVLEMTWQKSWQSAYLSHCPRLIKLLIRLTLIAVTNLRILVKQDSKWSNSHEQRSQQIPHAEFAMHKKGGVRIPRKSITNGALAGPTWSWTSSHGQSNPSRIDPNAGHSNSD